MRDQKLYESVGKYIDKYYIDKPDDIKLDKEMKSIFDRISEFRKKKATKKCNAEEDTDIEIDESAVESFDVESMQKMKATDAMSSTLATNRNIESLMGQMDETFSQRLLRLIDERGTYKRDYEGDFLCTEEAVRAMFADQRDVSGDVEVLEEFGLDVLNKDTIKGYRIIFEQLHSGHPWNALENDEFLMKLRAAAKNKNGTLSPTIAGLLFFGEAYHITEVFPNYFLDYREECDDKAVRWLFRTHSNEGDWSGNIYDFFCKVRTRMDDDVAVPFANRRDGYRVDRVDVHDALEEALANALAHANYYGRRGILVVKKGKELSISNPGTIRVTKEEFYAGGNSDPRNPNILKMFGFVNVGERAGSGVDKIMTAWAEQNWKKPEFDFSERSDRVTLKLEVGQVVYIPGAADIRNENTNQIIH